jgi:DNA-binding NarL/FixJ family response regulator
VIVTTPPLLRTLIVDVLQPHVDIDVVGVLDSRDTLPDGLVGLAPDLVVLGLPGTEDDRSAVPLLRATPDAKVLAVTADGGGAWLYEMRPHRSAMASLSVSSLVRLLKRHLPGRPSSG